MVRTVRVKQQEFDFVPFQINGLFCQIYVAATIDKDDAAKTASIVGIIFVGQREQLIAQMGNGEHGYRYVLHLI